MNEVVQLPTLDAQVVAGYRVFAAGQRAGDPVVFDFQINSAAAAAVNASGKDMPHGSENLP